MTPPSAVETLALPDDRQVAEASGRPLVSSIQVLRCIAATLVVLAHLPEPLYDYNLDNIMPNMTFGVFGVDLFFVISGFIMVFATGPARGARPAGQFLLRRVIRIVPLYWIFTTIFVATTWHGLRHVGVSAHEIRHMVASYLFLPAHEPASGDIYPTYPLGWTLNYEMFFYVCFTASLLLPRRAGVPVLAVALSSLVVLGAVLPLPWPLSYWARSQILEFVFGMLIARACLDGWRFPAKAAVPVVIAAIVAVPLYVPYIDDWDILRGLAWGLPAAGVVASAVMTPLFRPGSVTRGLEALGDASYSLYLVHYAFFLTAGYLLRPALTRHWIPAGLYAAMLFLGSFVCALLLYRLVELPMTRRLRRIATTRAPVVPAPLPGMFG